jgi:hypothetical protein
MIYIQGKPQGTITTGLEDIPPGRNCFDLQRLKPAPVELTKEQITIQRNRAQALARYHKKAAQRSNAGHSFCLPITTPAQSERTQAIAGRSL